MKQLISVQNIIPHDRLVIHKIELENYEDPDLEMKLLYYGVTTIQFVYTMKPFSTSEFSQLSI